MLMVLHLALVLDDLPVELVDQHIDGGIQVFGDAFSMQILAAQVQVDFCLLPLLFFGELVYSQDDCNINHVVEVPSNSLQLVLHVFADRRRQFKMMSTDCEIHTACSSG